MPLLALFHCVFVIGALFTDDAGDHGILFASPSANAKWILTLSSERKAQVWKFGGNVPIATQLVKGLPHGIAFHPTRQTAIIADGSGFVEWDWARNPAAVKPVFSPAANSKESIQDANNTLFLDVSSDGKMLAIVDTLSNVKIQAIPNGKPKTLGSGRFAGGDAQQVLFIPGGKLLCAVNIDKIIIFDVEKEKEIATLSDHKAAISSMNVSPNGKFLASGSVDGAVIIWDVDRKKAKQVTQLKKGDDLRVTLRFSPDGTLLVCEQGSEFSIFRSKDLELISKWKGPKSGASEILVTRDNRAIITVGSGLVPRYWDVNLRKEKGL